MTRLRARLYTLLRWLERYTKTDMVYLAKSGFWISLGNIAVSLFSLGLYVVFARTLSPEVYGTYQYLLAAGALIGALTLTGMSNAVIRAVARGQEGTLRTSVRVQLIWGLLPFAVSFAIAAYYAFQGNLMFAAGFLVMGVFTPLIYALNTYGSFLMGKKDFKRSFEYGFRINIFFYGGLALVATLYPATLALLAANFVSQGIGLWLAYRATLRTYRPNTVEDPETIKYGKSLSLMGFLNIAMVQVDSILAFQFLGPAALAVYSFASAIPDRLVGLFRFIPLSMLPQLSTKSEDEARTMVSWNRVAWIFVFSIIAAAAYAAAAPVIFSILFPAYSESIAYSQLYALSLLGVLGAVFSAALVSQKKVKRLYIFNTLAPLAQLLLQISGIIFYGLWGLVAAKIIASWLTTLLAAGLLFGSRKVAAAENAS